MKAIVERLSDEISRTHVPYLETLLVDLWSDAGFIELRCGFTLRRDQALRQFTLKVPAVIGQTDAERELLIVVVFEQIEELIDEAIAENRAEVN